MSTSLFFIVGILSPILSWAVGGKDLLKDPQMECDEFIKFSGPTLEKKWKIGRENPDASKISLEIEKRLLKNNRVSREELLRLEDDERITYVDHLSDGNSVMAKYAMTSSDILSPNFHCDQLKTNIMGEVLGYGISFHLGLHVVPPVVWVKEKSGEKQIFSTRQLRLQSVKTSPFSLMLNGPEYRAFFHLTPSLTVMQKYNEDIEAIQLLDYLLLNIDRRLNKNWLMDVPSSKRVYAIDHGLTFLNQRKFWLKTLNIDMEDSVTSVALENTGANMKFREIEKGIRDTKESMERFWFSIQKKFSPSLCKGLLDSFKNIESDPLLLQVLPEGAMSDVKSRRDFVLANFCAQL